MTSAAAQALDNVFFALSDATRRRIVQELARGQATVGQLAAPFSLAPSTITKHLQILERAGLIVRERDGRHRRNRLNPKALRQGLRWMHDMDELWGDQLDALERFLARERSKTSAEPDAPEGPDT